MVPVGIKMLACTVMLRPMTLIGANSANKSCVGLLIVSSTVETGLPTVSGVGSRPDVMVPFMIRLVYFAKPGPWLVGAIDVLATTLMVNGLPANSNRSFPLT